MTLTAKQWKEAQIGYGLEEVPRGIRKEFRCCMCGADWPGKLWTNLELPRFTGSLQAYRKAFEGLRNECYCRYHAEQMFGPMEEKGNHASINQA